MEAPSERSEVLASVETNNEIKDEPGASSKPALTPPTSEDMDRKERMSSELTELEDDDDDGEEIEPDHYFEGGKIPVFKPVGVAFTLLCIFGHVGKTFIETFLGSAQLAWSVNVLTGRHCRQWSSSGASRNSPIRSISMA